VRYAGSLEIEAAGDGSPATWGSKRGGIAMKTAAIVLALVFVVVAVVYFVLPAGSLPSFFPGFEPGSARVHVKHGIAALAVAVVLFGVGWFLGRSPR
jgi:hypothetical protein